MSEDVPGMMVTFALQLSDLHGRVDSLTAAVADLHAALTRLRDVVQAMAEGVPVSEERGA